MKIFRPFLIAFIAALSVPAAAQQTFTAFVAAAPSATMPCSGSDYLAVIQGGVTKKAACTTLPQLTAQGGLFINGATGTGSYARSDAGIEVQNSASHPGHVAFSAVNAVPGEGGSQSPETSFTASTKLVDGTFYETASYTSFPIQTAQRSGVTQTSASDVITGATIEVIGRLGGNSQANNPLIAFSNNSLWLLSGPTTSLYGYLGPPPANWAYNQGNLNTGGGIVVGGGSQSYAGTLSTGTNVMTSVTPDPTAANTFLVIGSALVGQNLPVGATVSATTSNSITFTGGNGFASGAATATSYPAAMPSNVGAEIKGYIRGARNFGGNGFTAGYDTGASRVIFEADNLNSSTLLPMSIIASGAKVNIGATPGAVNTLAEFGLAGSAVKLTPVASTVGLSIVRASGQASVSDSAGLVLDGASNADVYLNAFSNGTVILALGGGAIQVGSAAFTANGSVATALSSVGPSGAHTTVQEWFTVKNSSGTVRYIPAF